MNEKSQVLLKQMYASRGRRPKNEKQAEKLYDETLVKQYDQPDKMTADDLIYLQMVRDERKRRRGGVVGDED